jgi:hypothetical protein
MNVWTLQLPEQKCPFGRERKELARRRRERRATVVAANEGAFLKRR